MSEMALENRVLTWSRFTEKIATQQSPAKRDTIYDQFYIRPTRAETVFFFFFLYGCLCVVLLRSNSRPSLLKNPYATHRITCRRPMQQTNKSKSDGGAEIKRRENVSFFFFSVLAVRSFVSDERARPARLFKNLAQWALITVFIRSFAYDPRAQWRQPVRAG